MNEDERQKAVRKCVVAADSVVKDVVDLISDSDTYSEFYTSMAGALNEGRDDVDSSVKAIRRIVNDDDMVLAIIQIVMIGITMVSGELLRRRELDVEIISDSAKDD